VTHPTLDKWHDLVRTHNPAGLGELLADEVVFYSPVVHTPQIGKAVANQYLAAAFRVFLDPSFRYVREIVGERDAALEFQVELDGVSVNGVDMIKWNEAGRITEFKVMIRPLKAVNAIHQKMAGLLAGKQ
jgi:hypothetical protein